MLMMIFVGELVVLVVVVVVVVVVDVVVVDVVVVPVVVVCATDDRVAKRRAILSMAKLTAAV